jgi:hypothetical protein
VPTVSTTLLDTFRLILGRRHQKRVPMMHNLCCRAVFIALLLCLHALSQGTASSSNSSTTAAEDTGSLVQTLVMLPGTKWTRCFPDGRMNIIFSVEVDAAGTVHSGLALPAQAQVCISGRGFSKSQLCFQHTRTAGFRSFVVIACLKLHGRTSAALLSNDSRCLPASNMQQHCNLQVLT